VDNNELIKWLARNENVSCQQHLPSAYLCFVDWKLVFLEFNSLHE